MQMETAQFVIEIDAPCAVCNLRLRCAFDQGVGDKRNIGEVHPQQRMWMSEVDIDQHCIGSYTNIKIYLE